MSLPIILAIVLTVAILAWVAVYFVVRRRREAAAANKAFQPDPMDAEIGREALRRVFGILADEDPTPVAAPPIASLAPAAPIAAAAVMADRTAAAPVALGPIDPPPAPVEPAASVTPAAKPAEPPGPIAPVAAAAAITAAAKPPTPASAPTAPPPSSPPPSSPEPKAAGPAMAGSGFRLFAPDETESGAAAVPVAAASGGGTPPPPPKTRRGSSNSERPRFIRDSLGALLVTVGIVVVAVALLRPQLSILTGGVLPATATAPAIGDVTFVPIVTPSPTPLPSVAPTPSPTLAPSPSPSPSPSPTLAPTPSPTTAPTPPPKKATPTPTPRPTPVPTPPPTKKPTPTPTPTPPPPIVVTFIAAPGSVNAGDTVTFSGTYENGTSWTIDPGDGTASYTHSGSVSWTHVYNVIGDYYPTLTIHRGSANSTLGSAHVSVN